MFFIIFREADLEYLSRSVKWNFKVFVNTWISADKYTVEDSENLRLRIQMQLYEK